MFANRGPIAVMKRPRTPRGFLLYARRVLLGMKDNPSFPDPWLSLDAFEADLTALAEAEAKAQDRSPTAIADRNAKGLKVCQDIEHLRDYVQSVVETTGNAAEAIAMILGAGLDVRQDGNGPKPELAVKRGDVAGELLVIARAVAGAGVYYWEMSADLETWSALPDTRAASTQVSGLTVGHTYHFRFRALARKGKTDYSQVVSFMVH
jgi:hypothetical protein